MRVAVNIQDILKAIEEVKLRRLLSDLLSPINEEVKDFVRNKSIEFANLRVVVMTKARIVNKCKNGYNINEV